MIYIYILLKLMASLYLLVLQQ